MNTGAGGPDLGLPLGGFGALPGGQLPGLVVDLKVRSSENGRLSTGFGVELRQP